LREIDLEQKKFQELEEKQLKKIQQEERGFYALLASSLGALLRNELNIFGQNLNISQQLLKLDCLLDKASDEQDIEGQNEDIFDHGFVFVDPEMKINKSSLMRSLSGSVLSLTSTKDRDMKKEMKKCNTLYDIAENRPAFFEVEEEEDDNNENLEDKENVCQFPGSPIQLVGEERFLLARRNSFLSARHDRRTFSMRNEVSGDNTDTTILMVRGRDSSARDSHSVGISNIDQHLKLIEDQNNMILSNMDQSLKLDNLLNIRLGHL